MQRHSCQIQLINNLEKRGLTMSKKMTMKEKRQEFLDKMRKEFNCSWARYLMNINASNLDKPALFYRGKSITYGEMFDEAFRYAKSMKAMGIKKGMEIPMCLSLCPETIYTIIAASLIGARVNIFGSDFDKDYIKKIIDKTGSHIMFATDDVYAKIKGIMPDVKIDQVVMYSLTDSYPNGVNPYSILEKDYYDGVNKVPQFKNDINDRANVDMPMILDVKEFKDMGRHYVGQVEEKSSLEDLFSITYSSGTSNSTRPKAIKHRVSTYIAMGLAHYFGGDTTRLVGVRAYAGIPTHSNTSLVSTISDGFSQEQEVALEYIRDPHFFPISLQINKPNMCAETRSYWVQAIKDYLTKPEFKNVDLKFLLAAFSIGEPTSAGEEKFINKGFKKFKAGHKFTKGLFTLPIGMAGGDCEHSGIFFLPFKALMDKIPHKLGKKTETGYQTYRMVDWAILDKNGRHCGPNETGVLVANSPCNMISYRDNDEANHEFFVLDENRKTFGSFKLYSYYDEQGKLFLKGRVPEVETDLPLYLIQDEIAKDTKNILSCEVVEVEGMYVAHIELQPDCKKSLRYVLQSAELRLAKKFPNEIVEKVLYRQRSFEESYPLIHCGKRNPNELIKEGIIKTYKVVCNLRGEPKLKSGFGYTKESLGGKTMKMERVDE